MLERFRNIFSAPEAKASRTARLVAFESGGRARWTPRDYAALAREGYVKNAIVHRGVRLIVEAVGSLSFVLFDGDAEQSAHPLLDLIARPNPRQDGAGFLEALTAHLLLSGNGYIEAVTLEGAVRELYALRPDRMKVVPGPDGWPEAYEYTIGGRSLRFAQEANGPDMPPPILHLTLFNPLDDHYGLAPLEAAAVAVELTLFECPGFGVVLFHALWSGGPQAINGFANLSGLIMAYMAARFGVLGVYVSGRSREKQAVATGAAAPTIAGALVKAVTGHK